MIHLLEVTPDVTPALLSKLSRRYAMTGGYELSLADNLSSKDIEKLIDTFIPELKKEPHNTSRFKSSNAYRILNMIKNSSYVSTDSKLKIDKALS